MSKKSDIKLREIKIREKMAKEHYMIVDFLNEVEEQDWELDSDDIRHILKLDFDYVRKQNRTTITTKGNP